ncbi:MAG TPA: HAMP domain-containing methyl-accepting chemotaxis protein [Salinarimonas sp.]|nr:HAMP domain-containing methyl-accepting chemotaxis protein [Salinarimonas sp.]
MRRRELSIKTKLTLVLGLLGGLLVAIASGGWIGTRSMHGAVERIYADRVVPLRDLKVVADLYAVNIVDISHKVRNGNIDWAEGIRNVEAAKTDIRARWSTYRATPKAAHEAALAGAAEELMRKADRSVERLLGLLRDEERAALATFTIAELYAAIDPVSEALGKLVELQLNVAKVEAERTEVTYEQLAIGFAAASLVALLALFWAARAVGTGVSRPLSRIAGQMADLAAGRLDVQVTDAGKGDEIGALARSLEVFRQALVAKRASEEAGAAENEAKMRRAEVLDALTRRFEGTVATLTRSLSSAAAELQGTAGGMTAIADQTTGRSANVAAAAERTSANVGTVAAATEELSASVREIAAQVAQSTGIAAKAVERARGTDAAVQALSADAARIGEVVALISTIAEQTNLLALNATIEAARAGEAGRGFAVVASEVKALAGQTTKATEEISAQVARIQGATESTVGAVREIGGIIGEMASIAASVAAAVEEQGAATGEIARNVGEAAQGTGAVTAAIIEVRQGAGETGAAAAQVLDAARALADHSAGLGREVAAFLDGVRAA